MILYYFFNNYKFNKNHHAKYLQFINDKTIKIDKDYSSTCIFSDTVTNRQCNEFDTLGHVFFVTRLI